MTKKIILDDSNLEELYKYPPDTPPQQWIPITKGLPKEGQKVFIRFMNGGVSNTVFENDAFMWDEAIPYKSNAVTGWYPMPEDEPEVNA